MLVCLNLNAEMRISSSESPNPLPSLDFFPSMGNSWAIEAEREGFLHEKEELMQREKGAVQRDEELFCHAGVGIEEDKLAGNRLSKNSGSMMHTNSQHSLSRIDDAYGASRCKERVSRFTSASRCYPASVHARCTGWSSRQTEAADRGVLPRITRQEGKRISESGVNECGVTHSRQLAVALSITKCPRGKKFSSKGNWEKESSPSLYKCAVRKRYDDAAAYEDATRKQYDNAAANNAAPENPNSYKRAFRTCHDDAAGFNDAIRKRYDDAAAYNAAHIFLSENDSISGAYSSEFTRAKSFNSSKTNGGVGKEHHKMHSSLLWGGADNFDAHSDLEGPETKLASGKNCEAQESADVDDSGVIDPSRVCDHNKLSSRQNAQRSSNTTPLTVLRSPPVVLVDVTNKFELPAASDTRGKAQESDAHRLSQRMRQIEYGKNTLGYERYTELVPRLKRNARDPQTPNPKQICSKRSWDGQIRKWRKLLHVYDPPCEDGEEIAEDLSVLKLQPACNPNINSDPGAASTLPSRFCEVSGNTDGHNNEEKMGLEDANMTIYDDWMEL